jgi:lipopolysaccharide transport system permease protein
MIPTLIAHRALLWDLVKRDLANRYAGSALGFVWTVIQPLALIVIFTLVFGRLMAVPTGEGTSRAGFVTYLCAALLPWFVIADTLHRSSRLFIEHAGLVKKVSFPPVLLVGQIVGSGLLTLAVSFSLLLVVQAAAGRPPGAEVWILVPAFALLALLLAGFALGLAVLGVFFRDLQHLMPVITTIGFWLTPIAYTPNVLPAGILPLLAANPLLPVLSLFRRAAGVEPAWSAGLVPPAWGMLLPLAVAACGSLLFRALSRDILDEI